MNLMTESSSATQDTDFECSALVSGASVALYPAIWPLSMFLREAYPKLKQIEAWYMVVRHLLFNLMLSPIGAELKRRRISATPKDLSSITTLSVVWSHLVIDLDAEMRQDQPDLDVLAGSLLVKVVRLHQKSCHGTIFPLADPSKCLWLHTPFSNRRAAISAVRTLLEDQAPCRVLEPLLDSGMESVESVFSQG